ncbi:MAG: hypothetical protein ACFFCE_07050 [Promethearchaeota archaeon]
MALVLNGKERKIFFKDIILYILFLVLVMFHYYAFLWNQDDFRNHLTDNRDVYIAQGSDEDTSSPIISFINPSENNTIINVYTFIIEVNVSDENPPLNGSVTLQISNQTTSLFNATMFYENENLWFYYWSNVSAYSNGGEYIIQISAKDSSLSENVGKSEEYYVYINLPKSPGIFNVIFFFFIVSLISTGICVYLNKNLLTRSKTNNREK